jgi:hypothetical protein
LHFVCELRESRAARTDAAFLALGPRFRGDERMIRSQRITL